MGRSSNDHHQPIITLNNISVSYHRRKNLLSKSRIQVLRDVSFEIYRGETLGVVGKNGVGKSTLLKLLSGVIDPDSGVIWRGTDRISLLSLQLGFMPHLSGRDNAILSGLLQGASIEFVREKLQSVKEFSDLADFWDEPVETYSAGMRTRLGFSVSINASPEVLLVDEVLAVGDQEFRNKSRDAMRKLIASDQTVVLVSHNAQMISELCDRAVWIHEGVTRAVGDVQTVLDSYLGSVP